MYTLGIMTTQSPDHIPFPEVQFYTQIAQQAEKHNFKLFVFFPESISFHRKKISGFHYVDGRWVKSEFSYPDAVYDRVFYTGDYYKKNHAKVKRLKTIPSIQFINRGLPSKWEIYQLLSQDKLLRSYLPPQELYTTPQRLQEFIQTYESIVIKPISGGFGRGVLRLTLSNPVIIEGRNFNNKYVRKTYPSLQVACRQLIQRLNHKYLLQKYLDLTTQNGHPFDVRIFVQKNAQGIWEVLGKGIRIGQKYQLTSNLKGGGHAVDYSSFIQQQFPHQFTQIDHIIDQIGKRIPYVLEKRYSPLFELGIDIGIDRSGAVWIIEANAKPGRKIFDLIGNESAASKAISGPLRYARYLLENDQGGSTWQL